MFKALFAAALLTGILANNALAADESAQAIRDRREKKDYLMMQALKHHFATHAPSEYGPLKMTATLSAPPSNQDPQEYKTMFRTAYFANEKLRCRADAKPETQSDEAGVSKKYKDVWSDPNLVAARFSITCRDPRITPKSPLVEFPGIKTVMLVDPKSSKDLPKGAYALKTGISPSPVEPRVFGNRRFQNTVNAPIEHHAIFAPNWDREQVVGFRTFEADNSVPDTGISSWFRKAPAAN
jgi:hypothetical protein